MPVPNGQFIRIVFTLNIFYAQPTKKAACQLPLEYAFVC